MPAVLLHPPATVDISTQSRHEKHTSGSHARHLAEAANGTPTADRDNVGNGGHAVGLTHRQHRTHSHSTPSTDGVTGGVYYPQPQTLLAPSSAPAPNGSNAAYIRLPHSGVGTPPPLVPSISLNPDQFNRPITWEQFLDSIPVISTLRRLTDENADGTSSFNGIDMESIKFIGICLAWYTCSAIASNAGKQVLMHYKFPVTVSWIQFAFIAVYCFLWSQYTVATSASASSTKRRWEKKLIGLQPASYDVAAVVLPLCAFQIGSQVLTSIAISRVPVSFVHTVKALSPLFTVVAYRVVYDIEYSPRVYRALIPLTAGVMSVCAKDMHVHMVGLLCALGSCIIYVAQNIFSKRVLFKDEGVDGRARMDKMNMLFWSAVGAFVVLAPGWFLSEGRFLLASWIDSAAAPDSLATSRPTTAATDSLTTLEVAFYLWVNCTAHFAQALLAITVLASASPVTYSVASLMKRVVVITCAVIWFRQPIGALQAAGIACTFWGLWLYDRAKGDVQKGERVVAKLLSDGVGFVLPFATRARRKSDW